MILKEMLTFKSGFTVFKDDFSPSCSVVKQCWMKFLISLKNSIKWDICFRDLAKKGIKTLSEIHKLSPDVVAMLIISSNPENDV